MPGQMIQKLGFLLKKGEGDIDVNALLNCTLIRVFTILHYKPILHNTLLHNYFHAEGS
jgi:hypothetical protein